MSHSTNRNATINICKTKKARESSRAFLLRQLPTLPRRFQRSTLGLWTLNYCVRNGNRWNRSGIITAYLNESCSLKTSQKKLQANFTAYTSSHLRYCNVLSAVNVIQSHVAFARVLGTFSRTTCSPFSFILRIRFSDRSVSQALDRLVLVSSTHCCASTPSLSTLSSSRGLTSL